MENKLDMIKILKKKTIFRGVIKEDQLKIEKSKVLLINLNACITELAKRLILLGFNIYLYDTEKITEEDVTTNYFLSDEDLGKERLETLYSKISNLSTTVSITCIKDISQPKDIKFVCAGFSDFYSLETYEEYFTRKNIFFYCVNISGIYGFYYNNLKYGKNNRVLVDSTSFLKKGEKIISEIKTKKGFDRNINYLIYSIYLLEMYYRKNIEKKIIKTIMDKEKTEQHAFQKRIMFIENYFRINNLNFVFKNEKLFSLLRSFIVNFNKQFNPLCTIMGNKIANEIYYYLLGRSLPKVNIVTYNSEKQNFDYLAFLSN